MARDVKHGRCSVAFDTETVNIETGWMIVDLSDTDTFPHTIPAEGVTAHIEVTAVHVEIDPASSFRGHVELGFLKTVRSNVSNFHQIYCWSFATGSARTYESVYLHESPIVCDTRYHYGELHTDLSIFGSDKSLSGPQSSHGVGATYFAGEGDLVLRIQRTTGTVDCSITVSYNVVEDTN